MLPHFLHSGPRRTPALDYRLVGNVMGHMACPARGLAQRAARRAGKIGDILNHAVHHFSGLGAAASKFTSHRICHFGHPFT